MFVTVTSILLQVHNFYGNGGSRRARSVTRDCRYAYQANQHLVISTWGGFVASTLHYSARNRLGPGKLEQLPSMVTFG